MERSSYHKDGSGRVTCGNEAAKKSGHKNPIEHGIVANWDQLEGMLECFLKKMNLSLENRTVLFTEAPLNPKANRERLT